MSLFFLYLTKDAEKYVMRTSILCIQLYYITISVQKSVLVLFQNNLRLYGTPENAYHVSIHVYWACACKWKQVANVYSGPLVA